MWKSLGAFFYQVIYYSRDRIFFENNKVLDNVNCIYKMPQQSSFQ